MSKREKNIVLVGMRGAGKTTVGKILSERTGRELIEMDRIIEQREGKSIPEIVEKFGWQYFREKEEELCRELSCKKNLVISTGGGVVINPKNIKNLKKNGVIFFLYAPVEVLYKRIGEDPGRPSLTGENSLKDDLEKVWKQREKLYYQAADKVIDTSQILPEQVVEQILNYLKHEN